MYHESPGKREQRRRRKLSKGRMHGHCLALEKAQSHRLKTLSPPIKLTSKSPHPDTLSLNCFALFSSIFKSRGGGKNILKAARKRPVTPGDELSWWTRREAKR